MAANGAYGIGVPANITSSDVQIYYSYHAERSSDSTDNATFTELPSSILVPSKKSVANGYNDVSIPGMYNLKLPLDFIPYIYSLKKLNVLLMILEY